MWATLSAVASRATAVDWMLLFGSIFLFLYIVGTWNYDYFRRRGIASSRPRMPFLGDLLDTFIGTRAFQDVIKEQYENGAGHSVYGMFEFQRPIFLVRDPELLKVIAVKEFDHFMNHRSVQSQKADPIFSRNLFNLKDQHWRDMRATLSPAFTTSKIKGMFPLVSQCGEQMAKHLREVYAKSKEGSANEPLPTDMKDLYARMANDVIATAAFGVSCDSLKEPQNKFYHMGKVMTTFTRLRTMIFLGYLMFPKIMEYTRLRLLNPESVEFFDSLVHETIKERLKQGIFRPDMLQLLIQARKGELKTEATDAGEEEKISGKKILEDEDISAQAIIFFFAGFETISTALCLATYLLSHNQEVQRKLQQEIDDVMEATGGKPTYEAVQGMKYLDAVINEVLRVYPPAVATDRMCEADTVLPYGSENGPITIRKGDIINVPIVGLHYDTKYWDEPEEFRPERFFDENKHNIKPFTYMPFGVGPRICIGQRLALVEVKLGLLHLLANFNLHPCSKTKHPLEFAPGFNVMAKGGFWCGLTPR